MPLASSNKAELPAGGFSRGMYQYRLKYRLVGKLARAKGKT